MKIYQLFYRALSTYCPPSIIASFKNKIKPRRIKYFETNRPSCIKQQTIKKPVWLLWTFSLWSLKEKKIEDSMEVGKTKISKLIEEADKLFGLNKNREIITVLGEFKDTKNVEILWRLVRAEYNLSQEQSTSEAERKSLIFDAYTIILEALEIDDNHYATHKWMAVLLDARSAYDGLKARITQLERVKSHMMRAAELNPKDATTLYMIGNWCYQIADMPWIQRKIAATIFVAPPTSSFEEALPYFMKAEEVEPRFYSRNLLMLGKTYLKLKKDNHARYYLELVVNYPPSSEDDRAASKEANQLLSSMKPKQEPLPKSVPV
uniref:Regulator of microtubule dynamics protein 1 n=1 Tax=Clastoptera arizonana TaxID=38151 RepID=A0A1B6BYE1_9HEMI